MLTVASTGMVQPVSRSSIWIALFLFSLVVGGGVYLALWRWRTAQGSTAGTVGGDFIYCRQCGTRLKSTDNFCLECGHAIK